MKRSLALLLICTLLSACATTNSTGGAPAEKPKNIKEWVDQSRSRRQAVTGAFIGALAGAAGAALRGEDPLKGAAAGAVAGAVAGYLVGKRQDRIFAHRDFAVKQARYDKSQGYVATVEEVTFNPSQARPGETTTLYVRYLVVGPDPNEGIRITMFRGLKYGDDYIMGAGPNEFTVPKGGGIVEATMDVTLPAKAPQGTYAVEALIEHADGRFPQAIGTSSLYIVARAASPSESTARIAAR